MKNISSNNIKPSFDKLRMTGILFNFLIVLLLFVISTTFSILKAEQVTPDAYYNTIKHEYILNEDGTIIYNYEHSLKLLSYMSFNRLYGESFVTYNPDWQELKITKSETRIGDSTIIKSPFNAYNKVMPGAVGQAVPYMNLREMVITHTGLERNCEVNFAYSLTTKKGYYPGLINKIIIGKNEPVKYFEIVIKVPKDTKINFYMSNGGLTGEKFTRNNFDYYVWKIKDMPLIPVESQQPNMELFMPTLYFSTATNTDIARHISIDNETVFTLSEKSTIVCKEILKNQFSFQDKCFALRNYAYHNIGQTNIDLAELGWNVIPAQKTFDRNIGSQLDRAILLAAMCRVSGINADVALSTNFTNAKPDITLLSEFGEYLVYCTPESEKDMPLLLDPNNNQTSILPQSVVRKPSFVISQSKISLIPATDENGSLSFSAHLKLTKIPELVEGQGKIRLSGDYIPDFDYEKSNNSVNHTFTKNGWTVEDNGKDMVTGNEFAKDVLINKKLDKKIDDIIEFEIPSLSEKTANLKLIPVSRVTPYTLNSKIDEEYNISLELPDGMKSLFKPEDIDLSNPIGSVQSTIKIEDRQIIIQRSIKINKPIIAPEEYHHLYKLFSAWCNKYHNKIYLK
ncbi:MAG: DUF3857 domain-containing protein [bacterium]